MKSWKLVAALILFASPAFAQQGQNNNGHPQNCNNNQKSNKNCVAIMAGRWSFEILTGDTTTELADYGMSSIDTYFVQTGSTLTNIGSQTWDYTGADTYTLGLNATGTVTGNNVIITFTKPTAWAFGAPTFTETFTGTLNVPTDYPSEPITITGTYTNTMPSLWSTGSGNFIATWFPDFSNSTYVGVLDSLTVDGNITTQTYPASFTLTTNQTTGVLTGTVNVASLINPTTGVACFANQPLTIFDWSAQAVAQGWPAGLWGQSTAMGQTITIMAEDSLGNSIYISAYAVTSSQQPAAEGETWAYPSYPTPVATVNNGLGTNNDYVILFSIYGGPCDRWEGADKPFTLVHGNSTNSQSGQNGTGHGRHQNINGKN
jgi:hypothetical protein